MVDLVQYARVARIEYFLPSGTLTNEDLSSQFPDWSVEKIAKKTGIRSRHIAGDDEFSSDLAISSGLRLIAAQGLDPVDVDYLIVCTQTPDFYMPITAGIVHAGLGLRPSAGATDINLGCSGYIYGLGLAKALIESGQALNVLLITTDTYSKFLNPEDKAVRTIFGDGSAATLVIGDSPIEALAGFTYGTDGSGARHLFVPNSGLRPGTDLNTKASAEARGLVSNGFDLFMDGSEVFNFTLRVVPQSVETILGKAGLQLADVDLFVFHQANHFMLDHLRRKLGVSEEKFFVSMENVGNTVSSTIPIALADAEHAGKLEVGMKVMLLGFGVGLSWGGLILTHG